VIHPPGTAEMPGPFSVADLTADLRRLGVARGDKLIVHVSLAAIGWISGGGVALLHALQRAVGPPGCVLVPTFTTYLTDPALWLQRPIPAGWRAKVRDTLPGFQPDLHAAQPGLGRFPEIVRSAPGAVRSRHPIFSLAAVGDGAARLLDDSPYDWALGRQGPLGRLVEARGRVLVIGLPWWAKCTMFHLAEHLADYPGRRMYALPGRVATPQRSHWIDTSQLVFHDGDFAPLGAALAGLATAAPVGGAPATLLDATAVVEAAASWLCAHRDLRGFRFGPPHQDAVPAPAGRL
jgi:aminoglycoside 3-N-acetyltransferase